MRGQEGEQNPWQYPTGQAAPTVLQAMGVITLPVETGDRVESTISAACNMVDKGGQAVAVLLTQRFLGAKDF
jgi:sulfopyruvate decarboxylase TPP-binding subunit